MHPRQSAMRDDTSKGSFVQTRWSVYMNCSCRIICWSTSAVPSKATRSRDGTSCLALLKLEPWSASAMPVYRNGVEFQISFIEIGRKRIFMHCLPAERSLTALWNISGFLLSCFLQIMTLIQCRQWTASISSSALHFHVHNSWACVIPVQHHQYPNITSTTK